MRIHLIGVGGTGMGNLAALLSSMGHDVQGSDQGIYPPMDSILEAARVRVMEGYAASNLDPAPDLVIVGNVCRVDHVEARAALTRGLAVASMPAALAGLVLKDRTPLVVAGTHGKTTTTALLTHLLEGTGNDPGYLVGGRVRGRRLGSALGRGRWFVVEGDEYDSAFFEKWAKFLTYRTHGLILTSLEHDHVDIYPTAEQYVHAFEKLVSGLPATGLVVACADSEQVIEVSKRAPCRVVTYSTHPDARAQFRAIDIQASDSGQSFTLTSDADCIGEFFLPMTGIHNVANAAACLAMCIAEVGLAPTDLAATLKDFPGVARRQHVVGSPRDIRVVDDFGHHPTAVKLTIEGLRADSGPEGRIHAVLRPASATACRSLHQRGWVEALGAADHVILAPLARPDIDPAQRLDLDRLGRDLRDAGSDARLAPRLADIPALVASKARPGDTVVFFSNSDTATVLADVVVALAPDKTI